MKRTNEKTLTKHYDGERMNKRERMREREWEKRLEEKEWRKIRKNEQAEWLKENGQSSTKKYTEQNEK